MCEAGYSNSGLLMSITQIADSKSVILENVTMKLPQDLRRADQYLSTLFWLHKTTNIESHRFRSNVVYANTFLLYYPLFSSQQNFCVVVQFLIKKIEPYSELGISKPKKTKSDQHTVVKRRYRTTDELSRVTDFMSVQPGSQMAGFRNFQSIFHQVYGIHVPVSRSRPRLGFSLQLQCLPLSNVDNFKRVS
jgi:hypothetical protein